MVWKGLTVLLVVVVVLMLVGQLLGMPMVLGYVETGSMEPTLDAGDGFIAVPPMLAGEIAEGDVITFDAEELHGGGLTTHRVVEDTPEGFITQGDANPVTDQDGDEPPVTDGQVAAVALSFGDDPVRIPYLGTVLMAIQGLFDGLLGGLAGIPLIGGLADFGIGTAMTGLGLLILFGSYAWDSARGERRGTARSRDRAGVIRFSAILFVLLLLILAPLTLSMVIPSGVDSTTIISSSSPSEDVNVIEAGESQEVTYEASNSGFLPRVVMLEPASEGVTVTDGRFAIWHGDTHEAMVYLHAPEETGAYERSISERHYVQVLPLPLIQTMHDVHPWVAILGINLFVGTIVVGVTAALLGTSPLRLRSRGRDLDPVARLKRLLR